MPAVSELRGIGSLRVCGASEPVTNVAQHKSDGELCDLSSAEMVILWTAFKSCIDCSISRSLSLGKRWNNIPIRFISVFT